MSASSSPIRFSPYFLPAAIVLSVVVVAAWGTQWQGLVVLLVVIVLVAWLLRAGPEVVAQFRNSGQTLFGTGSSS
jgi:hypothetical protein